MGVENVAEFRHWFVAWQLNHPWISDEKTQSVELRLAEYMRGDWSEPQLRGQLGTLLMSGMRWPSQPPGIHRPESDLASASLLEYEREQGGASGHLDIADVMN